MAHLLGGVGFFLITEKTAKTASFLIKCIPCHYMIKLIIISIAENVVRSRIEWIPNYYSIKCAFFLRLLIPSQVRGRLAFLRPGCRVNRLITFWR